VQSVGPGAGRDVAGLRLPVVGSVVATDQVGLPFTVVDAAGGQVEPISEFERKMVAGGHARLVVPVVRPGAYGNPLHEFVPHRRGAYRLAGRLRVDQAVPGRRSRRTSRRAAAGRRSVVGDPARAAKAAELLAMRAVLSRANDQLGVNVTLYARPAAHLRGADDGRPAHGHHPTCKPCCGTRAWPPLACTAPWLAELFWGDLERHHPGIDSLRLPPDVAAAWKQCIATQPDGRPRGERYGLLTAVPFELTFCFRYHGALILRPGQSG
jgi:hypothetical protein